MQQDIGLHGVTDGEFRRVDWLMDFKLGIGGVETLQAEPVHVPFRSEAGGVDWRFVPYRVGKLHLKSTIFGADFAFLKSVAKATPKLTMPSPSMMHYPGGRGIDRDGLSRYRAILRRPRRRLHRADQRRSASSAAAICRWTTRASRC